MRRLTRVVAAAAITLTGAANAFAAGGREDTSGVFVWAFLGVCAVIIMAQAIPALLMTIGAARGVAEALRERREIKAGTGADNH